MRPNDIVIVLDGGLVQSVSILNRYRRNKLGQAIIADLDTEGADLAEIGLIHLPDGTETEAVIHNQPIQRRTMKTRDTIEMTRSNRTDFERLKSVLACASKDQTRYAITKVLVKREAAGVTITATDGRRLRIDHFLIEASAGIYDIKVNSGSGIFLMRNKEKLTFPKTGQVIPSLDPNDAYALKGMGKRFVLWASAAQGCMIDPELIALNDDEGVTLYIQKKRPDISPAVMKNDTTTLVIMPYQVTENWGHELEQIRIAQAA